MDDRYLDKEQKFYNYRTAEVDGLNIFDINKASNSWAQNFLDDPNYMLESENSVMNIVHMTPAEYWKICARDVFNKPVDQLINQWRTLDEKTLDHLTQVILKYKKRFPITYINYASHNHPTQEGLHRMIVAGDLFGWDTKFPVMVIKWADEEKAAQEKENKRKNEVENNISRATDKALRYKYYNINELKDQLYSEIEYQLKYDDEFENKDFKLTLDRNKTNDGYLVTVNDKYQIEIYDYDINIKENVVQKLDDISDEDYLSSWLTESLVKAYTFPGDYLISNELLHDLKETFGHDYSEKPICKDICKYVADRCIECEPIYFKVGVWKKAGLDFENISNRGHCVVKFEDKLYDYTSNQYIDYGIDYMKGVRVLTFDLNLSKSLHADVYSNDNYIIII